MQIKKHLKPKKIILALFIAWIIYLIGIPLYYTPYALQPSYWEFKRLCEINNLPKSIEKYNKILGYFDMALDGNIGPNWNKNKKYNSRISLWLYIYYKNKNDTRLEFDNIEKIYFRPEWKKYTPDIEGNEGSGFSVIWDNTIDCKKFVGANDG